MQRFLAMLFLYLTLVIFGMELLDALARGEYQVLSVGQQWFSLSPNGLTGFSNFLSAMAVWLWDPLFLFLLRIPAWGPSLLMAILFYLLARRPARRKKMFR